MHKKLVTGNQEAIKEINHTSNSNKKSSRMKIKSLEKTSSERFSQDDIFLENEIKLPKQRYNQKAFDDFENCSSNCKPNLSVKDNFKPLEVKVHAIQNYQNKMFKTISKIKNTILNFQSKLKNSSNIFCDNCGIIYSDIKFFRDHFDCSQKICHQCSACCFICDKYFCLINKVNNCHYCHKQICSICFSNQENSSKSRFDQCEVCLEWLCDNCKIDHNNSKYCYKCLFTDLGIKISKCESKKLNDNIKSLNLFNFKLKNFELIQLFKFVSNSNNLKSINISLFINSKNIELFYSFIESIRINLSLKSFNILFHERIKIDILTNIINDNFDCLKKLQNFSFSFPKFIRSDTPDNAKYNAFNINAKCTLYFFNSNEEKPIKGLPSDCETILFSN